MKSRRRVNSTVRWLINSMKRALPFLVLSLLLNFDLAAQTPANRADALRRLKGCATRPITRGCGLDTVDYLVALYNRGDHAVLTPLLVAGLSSDGALSELLGGFYSDVLSKNPRLFLAAIRSRPTKQQRDLCWMAGAVDGSGMEPTMLSHVRRSLRVISSRRNDALAPIARTCLANVNRANAPNGR